MVKTRSGKNTDATESENQRSTHKVPIKAFSTLVDNVRDEDSDGLVFLGCGGDIMEWANGMMNMMIDEKVATGKTFDSPFQVVTTGGRIDLVFPFAKNGDHSKVVPKLAMWRLTFGDCSWMSDYIVNYAKHHAV